MCWTHVPRGYLRSLSKYIRKAKLFDTTQGSMRLVPPAPRLGDCQTARRWSSNSIIRKWEEPTSSLTLEVSPLVHDKQCNYAHVSQACQSRSWFLIQRFTSHPSPPVTNLYLIAASVAGSPNAIMATEAQKGSFLRQQRSPPGKTTWRADQRAEA